MQVDTYVRTSCVHFQVMNVLTRAYVHVCLYILIYTYVCMCACVLLHVCTDACVLLFVHVATLNQRTMNR